MSTRELLSGYLISAPTPAPAELSPSHVVWLWSPRSPCCGAASPGVSGDAWASSQSWIPRLVFSSVSFFPQCVIAVHSPPQLSPVLAERGGPSRGLRDSGRCWREPSPGLLLAALGPASPNGDGVLPIYTAREGLSPSQLVQGGREGRGEQQTVNLDTRSIPTWCERRVMEIVPPRVASHSRRECVAAWLLHGWWPCPPATGLWAKWAGIRSTQPGLCTMSCCWAAWE